MPFADFGLLPNAVRYEIIPAGAVQMRVESKGREAQVREIATTAGALVL